MALKRFTLFLGASVILQMGAASALRAADAPPAELVLEKGDHICLIGNTLADRMQHHGWLETLVQGRFPYQELTFRDLGFSGDEVDLKLRLRSEAFGSPDEHLARRSSATGNPGPGRRDWTSSKSSLPISSPTRRAKNTTTSLFRES
jgi:hypothetical protein